MPTIVSVDYNEFIFRPLTRARLQDLVFCWWCWSRPRQGRMVFTERCRREPLAKSLAGRTHCTDEPQRSAVKRGSSCKRGSGGNWRPHKSSFIRNAIKRVFHSDIVCLRMASLNVHFHIVWTLESFESSHISSHYSTPPPVLMQTSGIGYILSNLPWCSHNNNAYMAYMHSTKINSSVYNSRLQTRLLISQSKCPSIHATSVIIPQQCKFETFLKQGIIRWCSAQRSPSRQLIKLFISRGGQITEKTFHG